MAGAANNIDGIKFFNRGDETPEIDGAAIDQAHKHKMGTVAHLSQNNVAMYDAQKLLAGVAAAVAAEKAKMTTSFLRRRLRLC